MISWVFWLLLVSSGVAERIRDKMYTPIKGASCFRRLNGTHQFGCSSDHFGSVGVLHLIQIEADFDFLHQNPPSPPYAPLIPPHLFTRKNMIRLKEAGSKNISVVILINHTDKMTQFSHELNCPNAYSGISVSNSTISSSCDSSKGPENTWNPWGTGLLHEDFPFPIFYIAEENEIKKLIDCFEKFNNFDFESKTQRRCAIEINTFMSAAVSTEVCMRRTNFVNNLSRSKYCDPLEGRNIYATLFPRPIVQLEDQDEAKRLTSRKINTEEKFILVSCRLDTTSMFEGVGEGALDSLMGYATLLNVGHMLSVLLPKNSGLLHRNLNILFVIFNGESYDYIGSQRFVYDLENFEFPTKSTATNAISFENIEFMLDIGVIDNISNIKLHSLNEFSHYNSMLEKLQRYGNLFDFKISIETAVGTHLPPTSAQSFLRKNNSFPAMILNSPPANKYYHSIYDNKDNVHFSYGNKSESFMELMSAFEALKYFSPESVQMKLRNISSVISMALYETLTGHQYKQTQLANPLLVDELLYCFLESADCPLFKAASHPNSLPGLKSPPMRYISVAGGPQESSGWTYRLLGYLVSQYVANASMNDCAFLPFHWVSGYDGKGECRWGTQNYSYALSPAFLLEDYDWKSGQYSTWTESTWSQFSSRMFLRPSRIYEIVTLCIGLIVFIISFCLVYIISSRSDVLFEDAPSSTDTLTEPTAC